MWARISGIEAMKDTTADYMEQLYKFRCTVKDEVCEEIMTHNRMLDWVDQDLHKDNMFAFESMKAHHLHPDSTGGKKMAFDKATKGSYQLLVNWASGETLWVNYNIIFQDDPVSMAFYVKRNGLFSTPGWKSCK
jgi:hypothetical protein